jgi:hypothetical protein
MLGGHSDSAVPPRKKMEKKIDINDQEHLNFKTSKAVIRDPYLIF